MTDAEFIAEMQSINKSKFSKDVIRVLLRTMRLYGAPCPNLKAMSNAHSPRFRINRSLLKGSNVADFGLSDEELAEKYGCSYDTIKTRRSKGVAYDVPANLVTATIECPHCGGPVVKKWWNKK